VRRWRRRRRGSTFNRFFIHEPCSLSLLSCRRCHCVMLWCLRVEFDLFTGCLQVESGSRTRCVGVIT
jgi:hypothetical protein